MTTINNLFKIFLGEQQYRLIINQQKQFISNISYFKAIIYLMCIPITILLINTPKGFYINSILYSLFLILFAFTFGYNDIKSYFRRVKSWKTTLKIGLILCLLNSIMENSIIFLADVSDPQNLKSIYLNGNQLLIELSKYPIISLGEEFLRIFVFIAFLVILPVKFPKKILLAIIFSSFVFGLLHTFGYNFITGLAIFIGAIPYLFILIYHNSILPLIIAHFLKDSYVAIKYSEYGMDLYTTLLLFTLSLVIIGILEYCTSILKNKR